MVYSFVVVIVAVTGRLLCKRDSCSFNISTTWLIYSSDFMVKRLNVESKMLMFKVRYRDVGFFLFIQSVKCKLL